MLLTIFVYQLPEQLIIKNSNLSLLILKLPHNTCLHV
jgi:hypothetical protein